jgi:hypothetical protein
MEFLIGWFNDKRVATNTYWDGFRVALNMLPSLGIDLNRTDELYVKSISLP